MGREQSIQVVKAYYDAFNRADFAGMIAILSDDVAHDINQGERVVGKQAFTSFLGMMDTHYKERAVSLVVMASDDGKRASAEFIIEGTYKKTAEGLPPAKAQTYRLPVGAFFEIANGKITRVTNYYNLADWIAQVS